MSGTITYLNPAAIRRFPGILEVKLQHPILAGLISTVQQGKEKFFIREVECNQQVFEQSIHYIAESDLIRSYIVDITARKQVEAALRESQRRLGSLINSLPGIVFSCTNDPEWSITYLSEGCLNLTGYKSEELVRYGVMPYNSITHAEDLPKVFQAIEMALAQKQPYVVEYRIRTKSGQEKWFWEKGSGVFDSNGTVLGLEGFITDITERKQAESQLRHNALHDGLTGLPNRALFVDRLERALQHAKRHKNYLFAVLFLDLDRFKAVNDNLGHLIGDQLLVAIARRLEGCLRGEDTVARLGGDEFTILLENIRNVGDAKRIADNIQQELMLPFNLSGHEVSTSASIGIALSTLGYDRPEDFLRDADKTMYHAKAKFHSN